MKSIVPLIALTLACAACTGEPPQDRAETAVVPPRTAESATAASPPDVTPDHSGTAAAPGPVAAAPASAPEGPGATSTTPTPPATMAPAPSSQPEGRRITAAELRPLVERGDAVLVDVRGASEFAYRRAAGAVHIPYQDVFARSVELPHEKLIALYCT
jgi:hypothetical protein